MSPRPAVRLPGLRVVSPLRLHRFDASDADLVLDTWPWRFRDLAEAVAVHRKLAGYRGARWTDWEATLRRLRAEASFAVLDWFARLPQRQRTWEPALPPRRPRPLFPLHARSHHPGGA